MIHKLILLQIAAHLLADFMFQSEKWSTQKANKFLGKYHIWHGLIVLFFSYICSLDYNFWFAAISLTILHILTDMLKSYLIIRSKSRDVKQEWFFWDQLLHLIIIIFVVLAYQRFHGINFILTVDIKVIAIISGFIFCSKPSNIIINKIFNVFKIEIPNDHEMKDKELIDTKERSLPNAGKLIGITERFLTLALILAGQFGAVGFIVAAKSVLRFNSNQKNEYILIGTLLSFSLATITGILILHF